MLKRGSGFWERERRASWPLDFDDWLFLGRAYLELGAARFGSEWTGQEALVDPLVRSSSAPNLLVVNHGARGLAIQRELVEAGAIGKIRAAVLFSPRHQMVSIESSKWALSTSRWFDCCQMNYAEPDSWGYAGNGFSPIFLEGEAFRAYLRTDEIDSSITSEAVSAVAAPKSVPAWYAEPATKAAVEKWLAENNRLRTTDNVTDALVSLWAEHQTWASRARSTFRDAVVTNPR